MLRAALAAAALLLASNDRAVAAAPAKAKSKTPAPKAFQDEVRRPAKEDASNFGKRHDDKEQVLVRGTQREPFHFADTEDIHALIDSAYARVAAMLKEDDEEHSGILGHVHLKDFCTVLLNPDGVPLSDTELSAMDAEIIAYMQREGFYIPGHTILEEIPVTLTFLHSWQTQHWLLEVGPRLTKVRRAEQAKRAAAEKARMEAEAAAAAARAAADEVTHVAATGDDRSSAAALHDTDALGAASAAAAAAAADAVVEQAPAPDAADADATENTQAVPELDFAVDPDDPLAAVLGINSAEDAERALAGAGAGEAAQEPLPGEEDAGGEAVIGEVADGGAEADAGSEEPQQEGEEWAGESGAEAGSEEGEGDGGYDAAGVGGDEEGPGEDAGTDADAASGSGDEL